MADKSDKLKGKIKETAGKVTGNEKLESEGKAQRVKGTVQDKLDGAKGSVRDKLGGAKDRIEGTVEGLRDDKGSDSK